MHKYTALQAQQVLPGGRGMVPQVPLARWAPSVRQENRAPLVLLVQQERRVQQVLPGGQERVPPVLPVQQGPLDRQESKAPPVPPDLREQQAPRDRLEQLGKPARQGQRGKQGPPVQQVRQGRQRISLTIRLPLLLIPNIRWYPGRRSPYFRT